MGSSASRTVKIENPNFIKITDDVVQRIRGHQGKSRLDCNNNNNTQEIGATTSAPSSHAVQMANSFVYYGEPTITAFDVRQQKEQELRNNDVYWQRRLNEQENHFQQTVGILENEYDLALDNVRNRFRNASPQSQLPPCRELKQKVIDCYNQYPLQTLLCTDAVTAFTNCVDMHRTKLLINKHGNATTVALATNTNNAKAGN